jgi:ABC-type uncharacterized transport system ATPase component
VVKNLFRHRKTRYRGLAKNAAQLFSLFGLANLMPARRWLLDTHTAKLRPETGKCAENPSKHVALIEKQTNLLARFG